MSKNMINFKHTLKFHLIEVPAYSSSFWAILRQLEFSLSLHG